ncbi:hypothetical protein SCA6_002686 [Theobroma cacao]
METWFVILVTISISLLFRALINLLSSHSENPSQTLPPGPANIPIISNILWLRRTFSELEPILRNLHNKLGPMVTLNILSRPAIFISDRSLAHQALIQSGALFADRPEPPFIAKIVTCNQHNINSAPYGPTWRLLRRNLTAQILHPSRIKSYSHARKWVLQILLESLISHSKTGEPVRAVDHFQYAMFCLLVLMCFGDKLNQEQIKEIESIQRRLLIDVGGRFNLLNFWPNLTRFLLHKRWKEFCQALEVQEKVLVHLIRARKKVKEERLSKSKEDKEEADDDDVREDTVLGGFSVPKNATINFMIAEMGWDPKIWEDPMSFKPERFLSSGNKSGEVFDITGTREIKMMPFGVGRRICPGLGLAMLHLEYFVANLVWNLEWKAMDGDEVSLEEKQEFTVGMKTPLQAHIYPRKR